MSCRVAVSVCACVLRGRYPFESSAAKAGYRKHMVQKISAGVPAHCNLGNTKYSRFARISPHEFNVQSLVWTWYTPKK